MNVEIKEPLKQCYEYIATLAEINRIKSVESLLGNVAYVYLNRRQRLKLIVRIFVSLFYCVTLCCLLCGCERIDTSSTGSDVVITNGVVYKHSWSHRDWYVALSNTVPQ